MKTYKEWAKLNEGHALEYPLKDLKNNLQKLQQVVTPMVTQYPQLRTIFDSIWNNMEKIENIAGQEFWHGAKSVDNPASQPQLQRFN